MSDILAKVNNVDPFNSDAIKEALSLFFQNISKHIDVDSKRWLTTLNDVINRFPKYCMSHRNTIETHLCKFLDSTSYPNVIEAAKCAHALQQVRPSQEKTATPKSSWRDQTSLLCEAAHALMSAIFPNAVDIHSSKHQQKETAPVQSLPLTTALKEITKLSGRNLNIENKNFQLSTRLKNILIFLQAMLVETYPVAKPVHPQIILDVIVRALSITSVKNIQHNSTEIIVVKTQTLRTIDALVCCLGPNLIPFSPLIFRFVSQTLKWSSENKSEQSREVRLIAYASLSNWLTVLHTHHTSQDGGKWEDEVTQHILEDITPPKRVMELNVSKLPTKNLSKKAKRKMMNAMLQESNIASHMPGEKNKNQTSELFDDKTAIAALNCAEIFLTVCGIFLKPTTHKQFQERVVRECYKIDAYSTEHSLALLRVLESSRKTTPSSVPPPTQYCLHLYSVLINSSNRQISQFCSQALLDIRLHLHCSPPSLSFAIETPKETAKEENKKRMISERNRAALESLLGPDKMPVANNESDEENEIITVPDEPECKKPRLSEDQISLSSESVKSVQIEEDLNEADEESIPEDNRKNLEEPTIQNLDDAAPEKDIEVLEKANAVDSDAETVVLEPVKANETNKEGDETDVISEAITQMPLNVSRDTLDGDESPCSLEIAYDYPNSVNEKVNVLEKMEEDIPNSNETDDIQITCGQVVQNSQDCTGKSKSQDEVVDNETPKMNGFDKSPEKIVENGVSWHSEVLEKVVDNGIVKEANAVTVEDMLADFVDEVVEDATADA